MLIRIPVFRRLWSAIAVSSLGDWLGLLATTALAAYLTKNSSGVAQGAAVSGVLLTRLLPDLLLGPVAGALVDRVDRRKVAIIGDCLAGLLYLSIPVAGTLTWLLVAQFLVEAVGLFTNPAKQAMWVNIVPRERLPVANQLNYVSIYGMVPVAAVIFALLSTVSQFFGATEVPTVAGSGALITGPASSSSIYIALIIDALTYFYSAGTVLLSRRMIPAFVGERSLSRSIFSLIGEGISYVRHSRIMRAIYIGILGAFGAGGLTAGVAQAYVSSLGAGNAGYGILFGSVFTGLAVGMLAGPKVLPTVPRRVVFTAAIGAAGGVLIVMSLLQDFLGATLAAAVMGLFAGIAWITGFTMIGQEVSDQLRGRVFAFVMSSVRLTLLGTIALGPIVAGAVGSHRLRVGDFRFTVSGAAVVLAGGGLVAILVSVYAGRQVVGSGHRLLRRVWGRRRADLLITASEHPGVLIAVEGADPDAVGRCAAAVRRMVEGRGYQVLQPTVAPAGAETPVPADGQAAALRAGADLADAVAGTIRPSLDASAVVVVAGYLDTLVVRYGVLAGMGEDRVLRIGLWAVDGLRPDLTLLVDEGPPMAAPMVSHEASPVAAPAAPVVPAVPPVEAPAVAPAAGSRSTQDGQVATDGGSEDPVPDAPQAFRDLASAAAERYLVVVPLPVGQEPPELPPEVAERVASALRSRSPLRADAGLATAVLDITLPDTTVTDTTVTDTTVTDTTVTDTTVPGGAVPDVTVLAGTVSSAGSHSGTSGAGSQPAGPHGVGPGAAVGPLR